MKEEIRSILKNLKTNLARHNKLLQEELSNNEEISEILYKIKKKVK